MARVIITYKIMPESMDVDVNNLKEKIKEKIENFGGEVGKVEIEPIAFGLNALKFIFVLDESKGDTEKLEDDIKSLDGVSNVNVEDVRRAVG